MCQFIGVPIVEEKTVGPDTSLQFAGITLDSILQEAGLPEDKLHKRHTLLTSFYSRRKVTVKKLQSLIGLLNIICSIILPGRAFLRRLIDLTVRLRRPYHRIRLSKDAKADLKVWMRFLGGFQWTCFLFRWLVGLVHRALVVHWRSRVERLWRIVWQKIVLWLMAWVVELLNITFLEFFPIVLLYIFGGRQWPIDAFVLWQIIAR